MERALTGPLPGDVRHNPRIEVVASIAYGIFYAVALSFLPVMLRRLGASSSLLAFYTAQTYIGSSLSTLGVVLMGRRHGCASGTAIHAAADSGGCPAAAAAALAGRYLGDPWAEPALHGLADQLLDLWAGLSDGPAAVRDC
jgi:hypothetical protein